MTPFRRPTLTVCVLAFVAILTALSLFHGYSNDPQFLRILLWVRVPETLTALFVGGALGLAGLLYQSVLRNPLAEPWVLGVAGGATLGAVAMTLLLGTALSGFGILPLRALTAFLLGGGSIFVLLRASRGNVYTLLLGGVVANITFASAARILTALLSPSQLAYVTNFLIGFIPTPPLWAPLLVILPCGWTLWRYAGKTRSLDLMLLSDDEASSLGLNVLGFRRELLAVATLLASVGVALVGMVGFVGLVSPHAARLLGGPRHRTLLLLTFLMGGGFLLGAHLLTRSISGVFHLPAGVTTTAVGAPVFLWLLLRRKREEPS